MQILGTRAESTVMGTGNPPDTGVLPNPAPRAVAGLVLWDRTGSYNFFFPIPHQAQESGEQDCSPGSLSASDKKQSSSSSRREL